MWKLPQTASEDASPWSKIGGGHTTWFANICWENTSMSAKFLDLQDESNPDNGTTVNDGPSVKALLMRNSSREPFTCELVYEDKIQLMIGLGADLCCAQHSATNGDSPYLVAYLESERMQSGEVEFLLSKSPTEILRRQCFPLKVLLDVATHFVETGKRSPLVQWEDA
jgi:Immunity protein Imm1